VRCVRVEELRERQDVYCLTVPRNSTFSIEGGLLVHNCLDEIRYACMSRPYSTTLHEKEPARFGLMGLGTGGVMILDDLDDLPTSPRSNVAKFERIR
jgi:hypothetical protein